MKHLILSIVLFFYFSVSVAQLEMPTIEDLPVRMTRSFGISLDMGWNSLVGFGPTVQYFISPHVGIDAGVGLSGTGIKFGGRGRYLFLEKNFTPFVAMGVNHSLGGGDSVLELEDPDNGNRIYYKIKPSTFIPITVGGDVVTGGGFFIMFDLGYSILVSGDNVEIVNGTPTQLQNRVLDISYRSGLVIDIGIGFIFKNKRGFGTF